MQKFLAELTKNLQLCKPITLTPQRYSYINIALNSSSIQENAENIIKIIPFSQSLSVKITRSRPYTIIAKILENDSNVANKEIHLVFFAGSVAGGASFFQ